MKKITILIPCFNEINNIQNMYDKIKLIIKQYNEISFKILFIDNNSDDGTKEKLIELSKKDSNLQLILNKRNFGWIRSQWHGLMEAKGDAVIQIAGDFQEPPELISNFIDEWLKENLLVVGIKTNSSEGKLKFALRTLYYKLINNFSKFKTVEHFTGFGLYDRSIIDKLKTIPDLYPYTRGLISDFGFDFKVVEYFQKERKAGKSKFKFFDLYDIALLGLISHSKIPLRIASFSGFVIAFICLVISFGYLIYKLILWDSFLNGIAPLIIGVFFLASIQLIFIGLVGEYVMSIHAQVMKRPHVVEEKRINMDN